MNSDFKRPLHLLKIKMSQEKIEKKIENTVIRIPIYDKNELIIMSLNSLIERRLDKTILITKSFTERMCVNYLRHQTTPYDLLTFQFDNSRFAKILICNKVLAKIADTYDWLKDECIEQMNVRMERYKYKNIEIEDLD